MADAAPFDLCISAPRVNQQPTIVVGVTHAQTCLVLGARLRALRNAGFRVLLLSSPGPLLDITATREGVERIALPMKRGIAPFADLVSLYRLWQFIGKCQPDLVEFSTPKAGLLGTLAAWLRGVPRRVYMLRGLKLETTSGFKRRILLATERMAARCAHVVLCNSESLRTETLALRVAPSSKLHLLGEGSSNGVDINRFSPVPSPIREHLGIPRSVPVVGFVGRLTRDKGLPELCEAFDLILCAEPSTRLLLVGWFDVSEDALDPGLRARILHHPNIHCTGFVPDTAPYYRAMDLLVLPTWREGFPNVVLEAAATGIPVVTTESTGARDSVLPEITGLIIPPGYPEAIYEAVIKLIRDPKRRQRMGRSARAWILEHYVESRVVGMTVDYYKSLLDYRLVASLQNAGGDRKAFAVADQ
ncbi:MAG: glycosyltransferase family 4 protein [Terracidiphilus sp.]|jgi:glycosyltransferase involved in cell wall biosynthesis